ncbi:MAG: tRNA (adenosine(37)-N6)-threonylcarbamoyltransferase complex ATPase subunit type 1 TsaE [Nitrospirota bacterium]
MVLQSKSEAETKEIGRKLGMKLKAGDVVCMYGELGSGKTTMVKGMASAIGINERDITSPSFTIIAEYEGNIPFNHIDLYRLEPEEVDNLGLEEYIGVKGISVIEWAEKAGKEIPDKSITIRLGYTGDNSREINIEGILLEDA